MKTLITSLLLCVPAFAAQSFLASTSGSVTWPSGYPAITTMSMEAAFDVVGNCLATTAFSTGNKNPNIITFTYPGASQNHLGLGCLTVGSKALSVGHSNGNTGTEVITNAQMSGVTTLVVRISRDYANDRKVIEAWDQNGTSLFPSPYYVTISGNSGSVIAASVSSVARTFVLSEAGMLKIRWARLKSTVPSSFGTLIPPEPIFVTAGDLGSWNFNTADISGANGITDSSGRSLTITHTGSTCPGSALSGCFTASLTPSTTVVQAFASAGNAGELVTLDGTSTFNFTETPITSGVWQYVSGGASVPLTNATSLTATALYPVAGTYVFSLSVAGFSRNATIPIANLDIDGYQLMPTNIDHGTYTQGFRLADVPSATYIKLRVRKPSGGEYLPVTASSSPATIRVDKRQANHYFMIEYYSASNKLLAQGEWQLMPVTATEIDTELPLKSVATIYGAGPLTRANFSSNTSTTTPTGTTRTDIVPFVSRYWERLYGVDYEEDVLSQVVRPTLVSSYTDFSNLVPIQVAERVQTTPALGINYEPAFNHMRYDYDIGRHRRAGGTSCPGGTGVVPATCWQNMDRFDVGEGNVFGSAGANGVLKLDGSTLLDVTTEAYTTSATSDTFSITDKLLIGYFEPFDELNWDVSTAAASNTNSYQYCSASSGAACTTWSTLTTTTDTTVSGGQLLAQDGRVRFTPPSGWVRSIESGTQLKWWIRFVKGSAGTTPTVIRLTGDNYQPEPLPAGPGRYITPYTHFAAGDGGTFTGLSISVPVAYGSGLTKTAVWEYWNGTAWTTLTTLTDTTTGGTATGSVTWTAPGSWVANTFLGSGSTARKWVRIIRSENGSVPTTYGGPISGTVTATGGTSSVAVSTGTGRGWDPTHANRVNVGLGVLEYNPNPPSDATARFQHQGRFLGGYSYNLFTMSALNLHTDGKRAWAHAALNGAKQHSANRPWLNHNAVFFDDIITNPGATHVMYPAALTSGPGWDASLGTTGYFAALTDLMTLVPSVMPGTNIGGNGADWELCKLIDSCKEEGQFNFTVPSSWELYRSDANSSLLHLDRLPLGLYGREYDRSGDPVDNPRGSVISIAYVEHRQSFSIGTMDSGVPRAPRNGGAAELGYIHWDRGNRGPMTALAYHYIGKNDQTRFAYNSQNILSGYYTTSQVQRRNTNPTWTLNTAMTYVSEIVGHQICFDGYDALADKPLSGGVAYEVMVGDNWLKFFKEPGSTCGDVPRSDMYGADAQVDPLGHAVGTPIYETSTCLLGTDCAPSADEVYTWSWVFPAMGIDLGSPLETRICYAVAAECVDNNPAHINTGTRWPMLKRAYAKGVVVAIVTDYSRSKVSEYTNYDSTVYNFNTEGWCTGSGCALYPLRADGKTDNRMCNYTSIGGSDYRTSDGGCTAMRVRQASEGYILMREPVN